MHSPETKSDEYQIKKTRGKFIAMSVAYFLGVFNSNFLSQTVLIMAITSGKSYIQSCVTIIMTLPFIILAAPAGWSADRFSKRSVIIAAKAAELFAVTIGVAGIYLLHWPAMMTVLAILGIQAAFFNPAINGSIPELYPDKYVMKANGILKMLSTAAILAGIAAAGFVQAITGTIGPLLKNIATAGTVILAAAAIGLAVSTGVPKYPAAAPDRRFPKSGPLRTVKDLWDIRSDRLLSISVTANAFFWFVGTLEVLVINQLGLSQFALGPSKTSILIVAELVGIAIGSMFAARLATGRKWYRVLSPAAFLMASSMAAVAAAGLLTGSLKMVFLVSVLAVMGISGGVFLIPLESFIQIRPAPDRKGAMIAAANFAAFSGVLLAGMVLGVLNWLRSAPTCDFLVMGTMSAVTAVWLRSVLSGKDYD